MGKKLAGEVANHFTQAYNKHTHPKTESESLHRSLNSRVKNSKPKFHENEAYQTQSCDTPGENEFQGWKKLNNVLVIS